MGNGPASATTTAARLARPYSAIRVPLTRTIVVDSGGAKQRGRWLRAIDQPVAATLAAVMSACATFTKFDAWLTIVAVPRI